MRSLKKVLCFLIVGVILVSLLAGCGGEKQQEPATTETKTSSESAGNNANAGGSDELKGEITHWVWGDYEIRGAKDFNKYYPDIKVNYVSIAQDEYQKKLMSTAASGLEMPDVANLEMTPRGALVNMDVWERLDAEPYNLNKDELVPFCIPLISNKKGEIVSVQIDNCVGGYAYNRELAKKYFGTDDPAEMEKLFPTLEAFVEAGKKVASESGGKDVLFQGVDDAFYACFGLFTDEPWVTDGKLTMDKSVLPSFQFIEKLVSANALGKYIQWSPAWNSSFAQNNIVFIPAPSWHISFTIKANDKDSKGKYGLMSPPGGGFSWGGTSYSIPKSIPEKNKMLAWTYIKWFTMSEEGQRCFVTEHQTPGLYLPAYDTDIYAPRPDEYFGGQDIMSKLLEIAKNPNTKVRPMTEYDQTIMDCITPIFRELEKGMSAEDAYAKLKSEILKKVPELSE